MARAFLVLAMLLSCAAASARDLGQWQYAAPDIAQYFATLMQPDNPSVSCCGEADAYWADATDTDAAGNLLAIITDTRPDEPLKRRHIPLGTKIVVPKEKLRKTPIANPFDHAIIFVAPSYDPSEGAYHVYCYEPLPGL